MPHHDDVLYFKVFDRVFRGGNDGVGVSSLVLARDNRRDAADHKQVTGLTAHQKRGIRARITAGNDQSLGTLAVRERVKEFALLHKVGFLEAVEPVNEIVEISGHACRSEKQMVAGV